MSGQPTREKIRAKPVSVAPLAYSRQLPQAIPMEEAVLSAIMIDRDAIGLIGDELRPEMFYRTAHQEIYAAAIQLYESGHDAGLLKLMEVLKRNGKLDKVGGPASLADISSKVTTSANIAFHARVITERHIKRQLIYASDDISRKAYRDDSDPLELLSEMEVVGQQITKEIAGGATTHAGTIAISLAEKIKLAREQGAMPGVVNTGLPSLDLTLGGLQPSDLIILAARPAMGKTSFALQVARKAATDQGVAVSLHSLEMNADQLVGNIICSEAGISKDRVRNYSLFEGDELERFEKTALTLEASIYVSDEPAVNIHQVRAAAKNAQRQAERDGKKLGIVIIDYLQLMSGVSTQRGFNNREREVSQISGGLKRLAKELNVPVLALSQLSRAVETRGGDRRPQLSDLRESGSLEQDADSVLFMYRPEYYKILEDEQGNSLKGVTEIIVGKNRHGEAKDVRARMYHDTGIFEEIGLDEFELLDAGPNGGHRAQNDDLAPYDPLIASGTIKRNEDEDIPF